MTQCRGLFGDEGKLEEKKPVWKIILILQSGNGSGKVDMDLKLTWKRNLIIWHLTGYWQVKEGRRKIWK